ncbi:MAG: NAD-dependent epimerase/dehydratase family protein [Pseudomonadota bacterium]
MGLSTATPGQAPPPGWQLARDDLDAVLESTEALWRDARGTRVLLTGVSGFVGAWLVETLLWANARLGLGMGVTLLARDVERLRAARPHWPRHAGVELFAADITAGPLPAGPHDLVLHGAAETNVRRDNPAPASMLMTSVTGTQRLLDACLPHPGTRFLFLSSGAVYGRQPSAHERLAETDPFGPDCASVQHAYGHGKRTAEVLVNCYASQGAVHGTSARCFAFSGPFLPLDSGFAVGNFVADALAGRPITILGDGTPLRSYMYGLDMAVWLWHILFRGRSGAAYNVGSPEAVSIAALAQRVRDIAGGASSPATQVMTPPTPGRLPERYIPEVRRAMDELDLHITVGLDEGLRRMAAWHRQQASH